MIYLLHLPALIFTCNIKLVSFGR